MTRLMYDSTEPAAIPAGSEIVAGYDSAGDAVLDAGIAWSEADWARFPHAIKVHIARFDFQDGDVLDVESGDATPAQAPAWIVRRQSEGLAVPTIYVNRSNLGTVVTACQGLVYDLWLATLDGTIPAGNWAAVQYLGSDRSGGNYDVSECAVWWPRGGDMFTETDRAQLQAIYNYANGLYTAVAPDASTNQIKAQLADLEAKVTALGASVPGPSLQPVLDSLAALAAAVARIEAALRTA